MKKVLAHILGYTMTLSLIACAPSVENKPAAEAPHDFGPQNQDVTLSLSGKSISNDFIRWNGVLDLSDYFEFAIELNELGVRTQNAAYTETARKWVEDYYSNERLHSSVDFKDSPYVEALIGFSRDEASATLQDVNKSLVKDLSTLQAWLQTAKQNTAWPVESIRYQNLMVFLKNFLEGLKSQIQYLDITSIVKDNLQAEFNQQADSNLQTLEQHLRKLNASANFEDAVQNLRSLVADFEYSLSQERLNMIQSGLNLSQSLKQMQDAQDALSVLVDLWRLLTPVQREEHFASANREFYDYLKEQDEKGLNCLKSRECTSFMISMAKSIKILPGIEEYGIDNLRQKVEKGTLEYLLMEVDESIARYFPGIPDLIFSKIQSEFSIQMSNIQQILTSYPQFVKTQASSWGEQQFAGREGRVFGLDRKNMKVMVNNFLRAQLAESGVQEVSAESLGGSLLSSELVSIRPEVAFDQILNQLNKLLTLGSYKKDSGVSQSLFLPMKSSQKNEKLDIYKVATTPISFAMPDVLNLVGPYQARMQNINYKFSVKPQAMLLRGIAKNIKLFQDWRSNVYDATLGKVHLGQIVKNLPDSLQSRKIFPKDAMFALSLANGAVILNNLLKELTPIFVLNQQSRIIWANEYDFTDEEVAAMAGVVDIENGQRGALVNASDLSYYILALKEFLEATDQIEKTQSTVLREKDEEGRTPVERLIKSRGQVRVLILGLANFLSHQMVSSNGLVNDVYSLKDKKVVSIKSSIQTQFLAIRALLTAYEYTQLPNYLWSALDIYYALNRGFFDAQTGFYKDHKNVFQVVKALLALSQIQSFLPESSQQQLAKLMAPWLKVLRQ